MCAGLFVSVLCGLLCVVFCRNFFGNVSERDARDFRNHSGFQAQLMIFLKRFPDNQKEPPHNKNVFALVCERLL
jgi:hypothetical protein